MRHLIIIFSACLGAFALPNLARSQKTAYVNGNSFQNVIAGVEEADYEKLNAIYDLDVFSYFDFGDDYPDTDLKKKVFKRKPEYAEKLAELKTKKTELTTSDCYLKLNDSFRSNSYDVKRKGFDIYLGENMGQGTIAARAPKSVDDFLLSPLPTKNSPSKLFSGVSTEQLFLPMNEESGLEIENSPEKVNVYFIFRISGRKTVQFKYMCLTYGWYNMTRKPLNSDRVRVIVANEETGKIYFDKVYKSK